jgi:hypothetical protein
MNNEKENILKLFKGGATIKGLVEMTYSELKQRESGKKPSERNKVNKADIKNMVEKIIYDSQMENKRVQL